MRKGRGIPKRMNKASESQSQRSAQWWRVMPMRGLAALGAASALVVLAVYKDGLTKVVQPWVSEAFAWIEDHVRPMPDDKLVGINLIFWNPSDVDKQRQMEALSVTLSPKQCKQVGGFAVTRTFDAGDRESYTRAIVQVACRASGRTTVTLTPQNGGTATVYDGVPKDWEQRPFPGVAGSHSYGEVVATMLSRDIPAGLWEPINRCQQTESCSDPVGASAAAGSTASAPK